MSKAQADIEFLSELEDLLEKRKTADPAQSYAAKMYAEGLDAILLKLNEEAGEMMLASRDFEANAGQRDALLGEAADVLYHWLLTLSHQGVQLSEVIAILKARSGQSGLAEKAARGQPGQ